MFSSLIHNNRGRILSRLKYCTSLILLNIARLPDNTKNLLFTHAISPFLGVHLMNRDQKK